MRTNLACIFTALVLWPASVNADEVTATLTVQHQEVYLAEQFVAQIEIQGTSEVIPPDLSGLEGFEVEYLGGQSNNAEYVSVINGKVQRTSTRGFVFSYRLRATTPGVVTIPPIDVRAAGRTLRTMAVQIRVLEPADNDDFRLVVELSKAAPYAGEIVEMTVIWYFGASVRSPFFTLPFLDSPDITTTDPDLVTTSGGEYYRVPVNGNDVVVEKSTAGLDGVQRATLSFSKYLVFLRPGEIVLADSMVGFETLGERRRAGVFDNTYRSFVIPGNEPRVLVREVPARGAIAGYRGHVGQYSISTSAEPLSTNVGDPITLVVSLWGPGAPVPFRGPDLATQAIAHDFAIRENTPLGRVSAGSREFEYTLRARHASVSEIPAIELYYFDPGSSSFRVARSQPIPLSVTATHVVTSQDAEGDQTPPPEESPPLPAEPSGGIAHNYDDPRGLRPQYAGLRAVTGRPGILAVVIVSLLLLAGPATWPMAGPRITAYLADPKRVAFQSCREALRELHHEPDPARILGGIMTEVRRYLATRLGMPGASATPFEMAEALRGRGVTDGPVPRLLSILSVCEQTSYAGNPVKRDEALRMADTAGEVCRTIEELLR